MDWGQLGNDALTYGTGGLVNTNGGIGGNPLTNLTDAAGNAADQAANAWKNQGPHAYQATGYNIDPNAFKNPYLTGDKAAWAAASQNPDQSALISALRDQANGVGPSIAQGQLTNATNRNMAQAGGLMAGARGLNPALAARNVGNERANASQEAAGQSAQLRLQEQMGARSALQNAISAGNSNAQYYAGLGAGADQNAVNAAIAGQQLGVTNALGAQGITAAAQTANNQLTGNYLTQLLGGGMSAAGSAGSMLLSEGGEVPMMPGADPNRDSVPTVLEPGEVVVSKKSPLHPLALAAAHGAMPASVAAAAAGPQNMAPPAPQQTPVPLRIRHPMAARILQWISDTGNGAADILNTGKIGGIGQSTSDMQYTSTGVAG